MEQTSWSGALDPGEEVREIRTFSVCFVRLPRALNTQLVHFPCCSRFVFVILLSFRRVSSSVQSSRKQMQF